MTKTFCRAGALALALSAAGMATAGTNPAVTVLTTPAATVLAPTGQGPAQAVTVGVGPGGQLQFSLRGQDCPAGTGPALPWPGCVPPMQGR